MSYTAPNVTELGSVRDLTLTRVNKIGTTLDIIDPQGDAIVGSIVPPRNP